jgi:hypothetical protein
MKNTVVFSGLQLTQNKHSNLEFDFLIISLPLKAIIQVEVNPKNNKNTRKHAKEQLQQGLKFFKEQLPFPSDENWKFIKTVSFGEPLKDICDECQTFVFTSDFEKKKNKKEENFSSQLRTFLNETLWKTEQGMNF